jgi:tRNA U54 and U55 pseudouridine synthase Pus10
LLIVRNAHRHTVNADGHKDVPHGVQLQRSPVLVFNLYNESQRNIVQNQPICDEKIYRENQTWRCTCNSAMRCDSATSASQTPMPAVR